MNRLVHALGEVYFYLPMWVQRMPIWRPMWGILVDDYLASYHEPIWTEEDKQRIAEFYAGIAEAEVGGDDGGEG